MAEPIVALRLEAHRDHNAVDVLSRVQRALEAAGFRLRDLGNGADCARVAVVIPPAVQERPHLGVAQADDIARLTRSTSEDELLALAEALSGHFDADIARLARGFIELHRRLQASRSVSRDLSDAADRVTGRMADRILQLEAQAGSGEPSKAEVDEARSG